MRFTAKIKKQSVRTKRTSGPNSFGHRRGEVSNSSVISMRAFTTIKSFVEHFAFRKLTFVLKRMGQIMYMRTETRSLTKSFGKRGSTGIDGQVQVGPQIPKASNNRHNSIKRFPNMTPKRLPKTWDIEKQRDFFGATLPPISWR